MTMTKIYSAARAATVTAMALVTSAAAGAAPAELGASVFNANCAVCHQPKGEGMAGLAPPLRSGQWSKLSTAREYAPGVLLAGMNGAITLEEGKFMGVMPTQNRLTDDEIAAVATFLVTELNKQAGFAPYTGAEVAALRQKATPVSELRALRKRVLGQ